jgi:hypothetical protein
MALTVSGLNVNTGIVSGAELEKVSREIFGAAQTISFQPSVQGQNSSSKIQSADAGINLYSQNTDIALAKQISNTKSGYDVQISSNALSNINMLNSQAALSQISSINKAVEGKIYVPVDKNIETVDLKSVFASSNAALLNTTSLKNDKKGSNPFAYTQSKAQSIEKENNEEESLSIFA